MNKIASLFLLSLIAFASCEKKQENSNDIKDSTKTDSTEAKKDKPELVLEWSSDSTLTTCESVLYDRLTEILYVSNINGDPTKKDNNGFIAKLGTDGKIKKLKWATGLSAPKGMGLMNGKLYVTDITALVEIDTVKGKITKRYEVPGAKFLNDVLVFEDTVYFTDSETNKIHVLKNGKVSDWKVDSLKQPNGLYAINGKLYLTSMGSADLKSIDKDSKEVTVLAKGIGAGDGIEGTGKANSFVLSNWMGQVFLFDDGKLELLLDTQDKKLNAADIGFIPGKNLVLVPTFFGNRVDAYKLKM